MVEDDLENRSLKDNDSSQFRRCIRNPIPEIYEAARLLDAAVSAYLLGKPSVSEELIRLANMEIIREWTESIWGANSPYIMFKDLENLSPILSKNQRVQVRMPTSSEKSELIARDGRRCRFCGIPLVRSELRMAIGKAYPDALKWGSRNIEQHAAFQAMWLQYDHVIPHSRDGDNNIENIVITCAPCNFGRMDNLVEEIELADPRDTPPLSTDWDGLERFLDSNR